MMFEKRITETATVRGKLPLKTQISIMYLHILWAINNDLWHVVYLSKAAASDCRLCAAELH